MNYMTSKLGVAQNIGLIDRVMRMIVAAVLIVGPVYLLNVSDTVFTISFGLSILLSVYPALTAILGWDPFYQLTSVRSCSNTGWNQCGTLPYEVDAAMGHQPTPDNDYDHSLAGSHR